VLDALRDFPSCRVLMGLPTYNDAGEHEASQGGETSETNETNETSESGQGGEMLPHPNAENLGTGLQGVIESLHDLRRSGNLPPNFAGVALFASWTTSPQEWDLFDAVWK
jgi:hypothetical protein